METAHTIDLNLIEELRDPDFARRFFTAELSADIARQLIELRKRRGLNQKEVAELADTKQPAISRAEQADYQNWSFKTLRAIADALKARIRVLIQPYEDVINEYEVPRNASDQSNPLNYLSAATLQADNFIFGLNRLPVEAQKGMTPFFRRDGQTFCRILGSTENMKKTNAAIYAVVNQGYGQYPELQMNVQPQVDESQSLLANN